MTGTMIRAETLPPVWVTLSALPRLATNHFGTTVFISRRVPVLPMPPATP